jgi:hypothetical protein
LQRLGALAVVAFVVIALGHRCACAPDVAFLLPDDGVAWITDPRPVDASLQGYEQERVPVVTFASSVELGTGTGDSVLHVEAARAHRVRVNGVELFASADPDPQWRAGHDVALGGGRSEIEIDVWNPRGPPLLRAYLDLGGKRRAPEWSVWRDAAAATPAVAADDTRPHPSAAASPQPRRAWRAQWPAVLGLFAAALVLSFGAAPWFAQQRARLPAIALALVHVGWLGLFATKFASLPVTTGFDATNHLAYVALLRREGRVPRPDEGWSTYHPPLYYATVAGLQQVFGGTSRADQIATKVPSFAAGLGTIWVSFGLARALLPLRPELAAVAVLFAGVLPLGVYMSAYVSNEPLHAFLFGASLLLCVRALLRARVRLRDAARVGIGVGLALLAKVTALLLAAVAGFFLLARSASAEGVRPARLLGISAAYTAPIAALSGWFHARNVQLYGTPIAGNWDLPGMTWWSQPGFHTPGYYLGFGESLRRPVLAGFHSFGDAIYSSFWGDGWIAGRASARFPTEIWNWDFAAIGYWLALPATLVLGWGVARSVRLAFAPEEGARRAAWSFLLALEAAVAFAMIALTLELPYFGQAKAPYLLGLVAPLAVAFALGADACDRALAKFGGANAARAGRALWLTIGAVLWLSMAA